MEGAVRLPTAALTSALAPGRTRQPDPTATVKPPAAGSGLAQPGNEAGAGAFLFPPSRYWPSPAARDNEARSPFRGYAASHPHAAILCPGREGRAVATAWRPFWIGEKKLALGSHLTWGQREPLEPLAAGTAQGGGTEEARRRRGGGSYCRLGGSSVSSLVFLRK